jgi:hypothetical protein
MEDNITVTTPEGEAVNLACAPHVGDGYYLVQRCTSVMGPIVEMGSSLGEEMEFYEPVFVRNDGEQWIAKDHTVLGVFMEHLGAYLIGDHETAVSAWQKKYESRLKDDVSVTDAIEELENMMASQEGPFDGDLVQFGCKVKFPPHIKGQMNVMVMEAVKQQLL